MRFSIKFSGILSAICRNQSFGDICGSLGQGTIVHEHYDIDLVLYSTSKLMYKILNKNWAELYAAIMYSHDLGLLPHIRDPMENGYDDILKQLNEYLRTDLETYDFLRMTNVGLKFRIESLDVDLLLSPLWTNWHELFTYLRTVTPRKMSLTGT